MFQWQHPSGAVMAAGWLMRMGWAFVAFAFIFSGPNAFSQTITECGDSDGYAYFFAGGAIPAQQAGMRKDGITGGRIILNFENNQVDLIINHAMGSTFSARQQGANVVLLPSSEGLIAVSVLYKEGMFENYIFQLDKSGNGTLAWPGMRTDKIITK